MSPAKTVGGITHSLHRATREWHQLMEEEEITKVDLPLANPFVSQVLRSSKKYTRSPARTLQLTESATTAPLKPCHCLSPSTVKTPIDAEQVKLLSGSKSSMVSGDSRSKDLVVQRVQSYLTPEMV